MVGLPGRKTSEKVFKILDKYKISSKPENYQLFYNYLIGKPRRLAEKVKNYIEFSTSFSQKSLTNLFGEIYGKDSLDLQFTTVSQIIKVLNQELSIVSKAIRDSNGSSNRIFGRIEKYSFFLKGKVAEKKAKEVISELLGDINKIQSCNTKFRKEVNDVLKTIKKLSRELEITRIESMYDALTGLYNRRIFDLRLREEIGRFNRYGAPFSLAFLDVDRLKMVNDNYGHVNGDKLLKYIAARINSKKRKIDIAARFGGDEFAIIFPNTNLKGGFQASENYKLHIAAGHIDIKNEKLKPSVSIGVAEMKKGFTNEQIIDLADRDMYQQKEKLKKKEKQ